MIQPQPVGAALRGFKGEQLAIGGGVAGRAGNGRVDGAVAHVQARHAEDVAQALQPGQVVRLRRAVFGNDEQVARFRADFFDGRLRRLRRQGHHAVGQVLPAVREKIDRHGRELEAGVAHVHGAINGRRVLHPLQAEPALDDGRGVEDALFKLVDRPGQGGGEVGNHVSGSFAAGREKGPDSSWRILGREMPAFCERLPGAQSCKRLSAGAKKAAKRTASCGQAVNRRSRLKARPLCLPAQFRTSKAGANFVP